jgi:hypothetical protein
VNDRGGDTILPDDPRAAAGRGPACLSHAALDRLALGEATADEAETARVHLAACAPCTNVQAQLAQDRSSFLAEANLRTLAADALARAEKSGLNQRPWWRRLVPALSLATAVGALALAAPSLLRHEEPRLGARKGAGGVSLYVLHTEPGATVSAGGTGAQGALHMGEVLHPGDRIRLALSPDSKKETHAIVLAREEAGAISIYHPAGDAAEPLAANPAGETLLPGAIELDGTVGKETLVALFCRKSVPVADAVAALKRSPSDLSEEALGLPCSAARYVITKVSR